jgi:glycine/D-amino acid oxidase-like deaminating enzyme
VHPGQFTNFFSEEFLKQPNTSLKFGQVVGMDLSTSSTSNVTSKTLGGSSQTKEVAVQCPKHVKVKTEKGQETVEADTVVLAAGPWTGDLATKMLGNKIGGKLGVTGSRAHSIVLKTKEPLTAHCLFTSMSMADGSAGEPEVYARPDGEYLYFSL